MPIQKEVWARDIREKLFPLNSFLVRSLNDDEFVENKTVHVQDEGTLPNVEINRSVFPAVVQGVTDNDGDYNVDEFTSDPTKVQDIEEIETNYNKRQSVLRRHIRQIDNKIANKMLVNWAATDAAAILRTLGDNRAANVPGATGTRKKFTLQSFFDAKNLMDDMDVPEMGRCVLLPSHFYNDLTQDEKDILLRLEFTGKARIENGEISRILGFDIYKRGKKNLLTYTNAATPVVRDVGAAALTTANAAALFWHEECVRRALGVVKTYANEDEAQWFGSIFSAMARAGGKKAYSDGLGVVAVVEAAGA
jgi:hypothetical protein